MIDPIYKIITGDENSADQMAAFCNQFDRVATELGCAVVYCHHHSKGAQGGNLGKAARAVLDVYFGKQEAQSVEILENAVH